MKEPHAHCWQFCETSARLSPSNRNDTKQSPLNSGLSLPVIWTSAIFVLLNFRMYGLNTHVRPSMHSRVRPDARRTQQHRPYHRRPVFCTKSLLNLFLLSVCTKYGTSMPATDGLGDSTSTARAPYMPSSTARVCIMASFDARTLKGVVVCCDMHQCSLVCVLSQIA